MSLGALDKLANLFGREGARPYRIGPNSLRVEAGFEDRPDNWLITVSENGWRLQHETGGQEDLTFSTEGAAMDYLWPRLYEPLLPPQP
jgi:hypothetical protein